MFSCHIPRACSLLRSKGHLQTHKSQSWSINIISTEHNGELSDPLCDSVNRGLTLVRLPSDWKKKCKAT